MDGGDARKGDFCIDTTRNQDSVINESIGRDRY